MLFIDIEKEASRKVEGRRKANRIRLQQVEPGIF